MKFLFDFFPILLFFIAYKMFDIYVATVVAIASSFIQVGWFWLQNRRIEKMHVITLGMLVVFGGATLILQDEIFIKWKPTVINWLFGVVFIGSQYIGEKSIVRRMMEGNISLPDAIWGRLNIAWALFFIVLGFINLYVAFNFDTDTWVNFKLFGLMGLTFLFIILQALYLGRFIEPENEAVVKEESVAEAAEKEQKP